MSPGGRCLWQPFQTPPWPCHAALLAASMRTGIRRVAQRQRQYHARGEKQMFPCNCVSSAKIWLHARYQCQRTLYMLAAFSYRGVACSHSPRMRIASREGAASLFACFISLSASASLMLIGVICRWTDRPSSGGPKATPPRLSAEA